jgi:hypothetical protein
VLTCRYYGNRLLAQVNARDGAGHRIATATYGAPDNGPGGLTTVAATATDIADLPAAVAALAELPVESSGAGLVADLYLTWAGQPDADGIATRLGELLAARAPAVRRLTVTVATRGAAMHHHFTFRPDAAVGPDSPGGPRPPAPGLTEDRLIRGLHPQVAERLQLARLREFDLTRLPSADEEIYLFKAVAKSNKDDERLVAMGQVSDLTPLHEADGRLVALPELENVLAGCLDAIRAIQAQRPQHKRFDSNRIMMHVWPASEFTVEELGSLVRRIRPTDSCSERHAMVSSSAGTRTEAAGR